MPFSVRHWSKPGLADGITASSLSGLASSSVANSSSVIVAGFLGAAGGVGGAPSTVTFLPSCKIVFFSSSTFCASDLALAPLTAPGPPPPIAPKIKLENASAPISLATVLSIPRSLAMPSDISCKPSSVAPVIAPLADLAAMLRARFLTEESKALSNLPVIKLPVNSPPSIPITPSAAAAVSTAFSSVISLAVLES